MAVWLAPNWKIAIIWAVSLIAVGAISARAQTYQGLLLVENQKVLSGNDIGFRVERTRDGIPVGRVVVRVDGRWVDTLRPTDVQAR